MKIAFIGDSYCANTTDKGSWPYIVADRCNADIIAEGLIGRALFHSYEVLLEVVDEADYIIFCITEPYRLPNRYGIDITPRTRWKENSVTLNKRVQATLEQAIDNYYNSIISFGWHEVAQEGLLMLIDKLMLEKKKKCIWFPCFNNSMQGFVPESGPIVDIILLQIADIRSHDDDGHRIRNHLDKPNNLKLANLIIDIINSNNFSPRPVVLKS